MSTFKIAVIEGDGIGHEVVPEGLRVLEAAGKKFGLSYEITHFDWSCEVYAKTGRMMPEDGLEQLKKFDAVFLGAVGYPGVPDHVSLWGLLIPIRRGFQQYVNLRPVKRPKGSTPRSADAFSAGASMSSPSRKRCSPGAGSIASCATHSSSRRNAAST